jgi:hypothetical protein
MSDPDLWIIFSNPETCEITDLVRAPIDTPFNVSACRVRLTQHPTHIKHAAEQVAKRLQRTGDTTDPAVQMRIADLREIAKGAA